MKINRVRKTDPETSHEAAAKQRDFGPGTYLASILAQYDNKMAARNGLTAREACLKARLTDGHERAYELKNSWGCLVWRKDPDDEGGLKLVKRNGQGVMMLTAKGKRKLRELDDQQGAGGADRG